MFLFIWKQSFYKHKISKSSYIFYISSNWRVSVQFSMNQMGWMFPLESPFHSNHFEIKWNFMKFVMQKQPYGVVEIMIVAYQANNSSLWFCMLISAIKVCTNKLYQLRNLKPILFVIVLHLNLKQRLKCVFVIRSNGKLSERTLFAGWR